MNYTVKYGEGITDVVLNATGNLANWQAILNANGFTEWIPALTAGQVVTIPDGVVINPRVKAMLLSYPRISGSVIPDFIGKSATFVNLLTNNIISKALADGISFTEASKRMAGKNNPETLTLSDALAKKDSKALSDSASLSDSNQGLFSRPLADSLSLSESSIMDHVSDADGNTYKLITINGQQWIAENLKTTKYNDGSSIPLVTDGATWSGLNSDAYCWYNNDSGNKADYGALYNWYAVSSGKLAPSGFRVATQTDYDNLIAFIGSTSDAGGKLKETGTSHWNTPNTSATDDYGFAGRGAGVRTSSDGSFLSFKNTLALWANTSVSIITSKSYILSYSAATISPNNNYIQSGYSVRCVRDL
jgi:uncharacterized protein (TIGR02145 family)